MTGFPGFNVFRGLKSLNLCVQSAFMTCGFILMNETFVGQFINNGQSFVVCSCSSFLVSFFDLVHDSFKIGPEHGTKTCIIQAVFFCLSCALFCRCNVSQSCAPGGGLVKARNYADLKAICQSLQAIWYSPPAVYKFLFKQQDIGIS